MRQVPPFDAVVLAGGRSSRLGGIPKALLEYDGGTLLARTLAAVEGAGAVAMVGPGDLLPAPEPHQLVVREDPPFGGPAAAVGVGLLALEAARKVGVPRTQLPQAQSPRPRLPQAQVTLILACDMPGIATLVPELLAQVAAHPREEAWIPMDAAGQVQYLACAAATGPLLDAVRRAGDLHGQPVRVLLANLQMYRFSLSSGATRDVDTWFDAQAFGIDRPH